MKAGMTMTGEYFYLAADENTSQLAELDVSKPIATEREGSPAKRRDNYI